jgi:hypothetical protein
VACLNGQTDYTKGPAGCKPAGCFLFRPPARQDALEVMLPCRRTLVGLLSSDAERVLRSGGTGARLPFRWPGKETGKIVLFTMPPCPVDATRSKYITAGSPKGSSQWPRVKARTTRG